MRHATRNLQSDTQHTIQHWTLPHIGSILWAIYDGPMANGTKSPGYIPERNSAICIPLTVLADLSSLSEKEAIEKLDESLWELKLDPELAKRHYVADEWYIEALPPETEPYMGRPVPRRKVPRNEVAMVPEGSKVTGLSLQERLRSLKKGLSEDSPSYPSGDDTWIGSMRFSKERTELWAGDVPVIRSTMSSTVIEDRPTIKIDTEPQYIKYLGVKENPLQAFVPSTIVIPVPRWIPDLDEAFNLKNIISIFGG